VSEARKLKILKDVFGAYYKNSDEMLFYCPKCKHHKKKLSINLDKDAFKCWVCDYSGRTIRRIIRTYGSYGQLSEWLELTNFIDINSFADDLFEIKSEVIREQEISLPDEFISLANKNLPYSSLYALNYLKRRGIFKEDIIRWKIGYCSEGKYRGRIIIPSFSLTGRCNYFIARTFLDDWRKYLNPPISRDIVFNHLFLDFDEDLSIVEGAFDAVVAGPNSVPLLGSTLREESRLFQEIIKNDVKVYVSLDLDAEKKALQLINSFLEYGIEVYKVDISPYSDVGEMVRKQYQQRKQNAEIMNKDDYLMRRLLKI
tara:strand:- start:9774 stop:10715 length:942 start_codon:yes stop_codon:yes gene_type:complete